MGIKDIEIKSILGGRVKTNLQNRYRHYKARLEASGKEYKINHKNKLNKIPSILKESIKFKQEKDDFIFEIIIRD